MKETVLETWRGQDSFAAIEYLNRNPDSLAVMKTYADLVRHLYWQEKDLYGVVAMARAGIQYAPTIDAAGVEDTLQTAELKGIAKGLAYDLASFTWPGWDEPGIEITPVYLAFGLDAARTNLRLAHELGRGDLPLSRAHWLLGAQQMAARDYEAAHLSFEHAVRYAEQAGAPLEALLASGYAQMVMALSSADETNAQSELAATQERLASMENGSGFVEQLETAWRLFSRPQF